MTYYMDLLAKGGRGAYVALGLLGLAAVFVALQAVLAYGRGTSRSVTRFLTVAGCAIVSFFVTPVLGGAVLPDKAIGAMLPLKSESLAPILEASAKEVLLPFVFVFVFLVCSVLVLIPYKLFCGIFGFSYARNNTATRLFAILVGAAHAIFTFLLVVSPIFNCMRYYEKAAEEKPTSAAASVYERYVEDTVESPLYKYPMEFLGERALDKLTK